MYNANKTSTLLAHAIKRTGLVLGLGVATAAFTQMASASCTYTIDNEWNTGFVATVTIKNDTSSAINGWNVSWQYSTNRSTGGWNANFSGSNPYSASNLGWNASIPVGQSASFGIQGNKNGGSVERPTVTGTGCSGTTSSVASTSVASSSVRSSVVSSVVSSSSVRTSSSVASSASSLANACPSQASSAFQTYAPKIPVAVQAEDFDPAGYNDSSTTNEGSAYRTDTAVDIKSISGGYAVGWMTNGEWMEYTVYVETEGDYDVTIRSGAVGDGRTLKLSQCSTTLIESFSVPNVSTWGEFKTWSAGKVHLAPGYQKIRVTVGSTDYLDLDWIYIGTYNGTIDPKTSSSSSISSSSVRSSSSSVSSASGKKFVGNITTGGQVRSDFAKYWNQITPENEGKWGSVEGTQNVYNWAPLDRIYSFARANNIPVKAHNFVWGAQAPSWINNLNATQIASEIDTWIHDYCTRYPDTQMIDVVNEAVAGHQPAAYAQKAFGNNWIQSVFALARKYCPNSILILNDYNNIQWQHNEFIALAKAQGNYIDAVGLQAHDVKGLSGATVKAAIDDIWNQVGKPIYISEYDIGDSNDSVQLQNFQQHIPVFWNHPHVAGITIWGYVNGRTWIDGSGLMTDGGVQRPAMSWLMNYIGK